MSSKNDFYEKHFCRMKEMCKDVIEYHSMSDEWLRRHIIFSKTITGKWCLKTYSFRNVIMSSTKDPKTLNHFKELSPRNLLREYYFDIFPDIPFHKREMLVNTSLNEIKKRG